MFSGNYRTDQSGTYQEKVGSFIMPLEDVTDSRMAAVKTLRVDRF